MGKPDPVPGGAEEELRVSGGARPGMDHSQVGSVLDAPSLVDQSPGEVGLLESVPEGATQAANLLECRPAQNAGAARECGCGYRSVGFLKQAGDVSSGRGAGFVDDVEPDHAEPVVECERIDRRPEDVALESAIVVEKTDQSSDLLVAPTFRPSGIPRFSQGSTTMSERAFGVTAVDDEDDLDVTTLGPS